jgi:hypothetical protein
VSKFSEEFQRQLRKVKTPEEAGRLLSKMLLNDREVVFAQGWNARQRLREENVIPTRADYEAELEAAKAKWGLG